MRKAHFAMNLSSASDHHYCVVFTSTANPSLTGASEKRLLREVAALRSRLAEASAEHMSRPEFPLEAPDSSPSAAAREAISPDALNSSDSRLEALQAEAHLLRDSLDGALITLFKH